MADEFVSLISHELRTPLTSVMGYLELVIDDENLPAEQQREFLRRAQSNVNHLVYLLNSVHELSRLDRGGQPLEQSHIAVAQLLREVADGFRRQSEEQGLRLLVEGGCEDVSLVSDRDCLTRALAHVLSNACKYTPSGGTVRLSAKEADGRVAITIEDTGIGIPSDEVGRVFTRFYRGSNVRAAARGAGLGLAIAKALIGSLGGEIGFESQPEAGTVFTLHLPLLPPQTSPLD